MTRLFIDDQEQTVVQYVFDKLSGNLILPEKTTWMQTAIIAGVVRRNTGYDKEIFTVRSKVLTKEEL